MVPYPVHWRVVRVFLTVMVATCLGALPTMAQSPASPQPSQTVGRRVALVIGNNAYLNAPLASPVKDARDMADVLQQAGFTLVTGAVVLDADKKAFEQAILEFGHQAQGAEAALFYYSGHGMEWDQQNWMTPVDSRISRAEDVPLSDVSADLVLQQITAAHAKFSFVILDACRPNLLHPRMSHATSGGLAAMIAPENTVIAFATQPGDYSYDGGTDRNSVYTGQLLTALRTPGLELFQLFNQAALSTIRASEGRQRPWTNYSPLDGEFYFLPRGSTPPGPVAAQATPTPTTASLTAPAQAGQSDPSFTLVNLSGQSVEDLRVSMASERNWGVNRVSEHTMRPGERLGLELPANGECKVDIRVSVANAADPVTTGLETCAYATLVIDRSGKVTPSDADFSLVNQTGRAASAIYVSLASDHNWGVNRVTSRLNTGDAVAIKLAAGQGCTVDIRAEFDDGTTTERRKVDTCALERWILN